MNARHDPRMKPHPHPRITMRPRRRSGPGAQRGAATLIVVMLLFFLVSLVAAYAARNLIFEQRTSTNQYRATQALETAEAGLEWALAMLNGGRIDASCTPLVPPDVSQNSFRQRYLAIDIDGNYTPRRWADNVTRERPSCIQDGTGWNCSCPSGATPTPTTPTGGEIHPAFRVCFEAVSPPQPGVVRVVSTARTSFVDQSCETAAEGNAGDAAASVSVVVALSSALATPPSAAATTRRNLGLTGVSATLVNTDAQSRGTTTHVGGSFSTIGGTLALRTLPGTPEAGSQVSDPQLGSLTVEQLFLSLFGMPVSTYRGQPATVRVDCSADCANRLNNAVQANPGRIVWVDGNVSSSTSLSLGSDDAPALIVVDGNVSLTGGNLDIVGLLYGRNDIALVGANLTVRGAVVAARDFNSVGGTVEIEYNPAHLTQPNLIPPVLSHLRLASGSLVRVPGSWRDFP